MTETAQMYDEMRSFYEAGNVDQARRIAAQIKKIEDKAPITFEEVAKDAPKRREEFIKEFPKKADEIVRSIAQGVTFGQADQMAAAAESLLKGTKYETELAKEKEKTRAIPLSTALPAELAGSLATGSLFAKAATKLIPALKTVGPWKKAAGAGTLTGGIYSAGMADPGERLEAAKLGALVGGAFGTGAATGGKVISEFDKLIPLRSMAQAVFQPAEFGKRILGRTLHESGVSPDLVRARLAKRAGTPTTLADLTGEAMTDLTAAVGSSSQRLAERVTSSFRSRLAGEGRRIKTALTNSLKGHGNLFLEKKGLFDRLKRIGEMSYKPAFAKFQSLGSKDLTFALNTPNGRNALREAIVAAKGQKDPTMFRSLKKLEQIIAAVGKRGKEKRITGKNAVLPLEVWDFIKRKGFDRELSKAKYINQEKTKSAGYTKFNDLGRDVLEARTILIKALDNATGGVKSPYAIARKKYSGEFATLRALDKGRNFQKLEKEQIIEDFKNMSEAEKTAYRNGAIKTLREQIETASEQGVSVSEKLLKNEFIREKTALLFPTRKAYNDFRRTVLGERKLSKVSKDVIKGGTASPLAAEVKKIKTAVGSGGAVLGGKLPGVHALIGAGIGRRAAEALIGSPTKTLETLVTRLKSTDPKVILQTLEEIAPHVNADTPLGVVTRAITAAGIIGVEKAKETEYAPGVSKVQVDSAADDLVKAINSVLGN